jgi:hypothetical protein
MSRAPSPISLAGSELGDVRHVCAFFNSDDEEYRVLLPFVKDGFERGDKAIHIVKSGHRSDHLQRLTRAGINATAAEQDGQLEIRISTGTYLRDGRFDQDRMLQVFEELVSGNVRSRFPLRRVLCRMDWAAGESFYTANVIEFESRVNDIWRRFDDVVICTYQISQFGGDDVIDILRTHPMVIVGGTLHGNPFFTAPKEFLHEFRSRRAPRGGSPAATT